MSKLVQTCHAYLHVGLPEKVRVKELRERVTGDLEVEEVPTSATFNTPKAHLE